jgi:poly-gamma-glutamate capsule biosynthesis protein CapA/YwtB (metallophosphatase superfamily)
VVGRIGGGRLRGAVILVALVAGACGVQRLPAEESGGSGESADSGLPMLAGGRSVPPELGSGKPITIAFGGDVNYEGSLRAQLAENPDALLADAAPVLSGADLAMVNLETAITERGTPADKEFTFRAPATAFASLTAGGVDVVTLANNHGVDFGPEGLSDTLAAAEAADADGFPLVGAGVDEAAAYTPWVTRVRGQRIGFLGATQVLDANLGSWVAGPGHPGLAVVQDPADLLFAVQALRPEVDTLVVYLHWGAEREACPSGRQQELARALVDAGADLIVGSHAHIPLAAGMLDGSLIAYGLGNFQFGSAGGETAASGVLTVEVTGQRVEGYEWHPMAIVGGSPQPLDPSATDLALTAWNESRACSGLEP